VNLQQPIINLQMFSVIQSDMMPAGGLPVIEKGSSIAQQ